MNIEKIRVSQFAPESVDLAWYNPQTKELRIFTNGEWALVAGGGGGESNLLIGSQEERLALEDPKEGLEFNQVNYNEETHIYSIQRFIRENNAWVELESPQTETQETVSLHVGTYDGLGNVEGIAVGIVDKQTQQTIQRFLDHDGNCTFQIIKGHQYTITVADLAGYHSLPDETFVAMLDERSITMIYQSTATNYETIVAHITVYNKNLVDITTSDTDFIGMELDLQVEGESSPRAVLVDANHTATFIVEYGKSYSITSPQKEGYKHRFADHFEHVAGVPIRELPFHYMEWVDAGIYAITNDGNYHSYDDVEAMTSSEREAIVAIAVNTSRLEAAGAGFMFKIPNVATGKSWAASNVEFDKTLLPFKQNHAAAVLDLNGALNTEKIIDIGDSMSVDTPAADWCAAQTLSVGGETKTGFLGAYGQMYALAENIAVINAIFSLCGKSAPGFTSGCWWASTQYSDSYAVLLCNGGFYYGKTGSYATVALFAL